MRARPPVSERLLHGARSAHGRLGLSLLAAFVVACAGELDHPERFAQQAQGAASFTQIGGSGGAPTLSSCPDMAVVIAASCATEGCHREPSPQSKIDLTAENLATRLAGQKGSDGTLLLNPASPKDSMIYQKLLPNPAVGVRMPILAPPFEPAATACVEVWIASLPPAP